MAEGSTDIPDPKPQKPGRPCVQGGTARVVTEASTPAPPGAHPNTSGGMGGKTPLYSSPHSGPDGNKQLLADPSPFGTPRFVRGEGRPVVAFSVAIPTGCRGCFLTA